MANTIYDPLLQSLNCLHCFTVDELRERTYMNPELLLDTREQFAIDHADCHKFKDKRKADQARQFRTERQRRELLERQRRQRVWYA